MADADLAVISGDQRSPQITAERFALGAVILYSLNFGLLTVFVVIVPFALVIGGVVLERLGAPLSSNSTSQDFTALILSLAAIGCLVSVTAVGWFFYWGVRGVAKGAITPTIVFLTVLALLHLGWTWRFGVGLEPINWFSAGVATISIIIVAVRWKSLFPQR